jgi:hypothetical protein
VPGQPGLHRDTLSRKTKKKKKKKKKPFFPRLSQLSTLDKEFYFSLVREKIFPMGFLSSCFKNKKQRSCLVYSFISFIFPVASVQGSKYVNVSALRSSNNKGRSV